jgi:hypothetical protein
MIRAVIAVAVLGALFATACGSGESQPAEPATSVASTGPAAPATAAATEELVGRWEHINECPQLTKALAEEGLETIAPSVAGDYFPNSTPEQLAKKDDVCDDAEGFVHSHFFTDSGTFGSLTEDLEQVDDGTYEILDGGRFRIGDADSGVVFRYEIEDDQLSLSPVITPAMKKEALAHPLEFSDAGWSVAVSYPGQVWKRVDCNGWC